MENKNLDAHVYDNTAKEMAVIAPRFLVRLANEMFNKKYPKDTTIKFLSNAYIKTDDKGIKHGIASDLCFQVLMETSPKELCVVEIQSTNDISIMQRAVEYAISTMIQQKNINSNNKETNFTFPNVGVLFLRKPSANLLSEKFIFHFPNNKPIEIKPMFIDACSYSLEQDFDKGLHFLLPFHILTLENQMGKMYKNGENVTEFLDKTYKQIYREIEKDCNNDIIDRREAGVLDNALRYVLNNVSQRIPYINQGGINMGLEHSNLKSNTAESNRDFVLDLDAKKFMVFGNLIYSEQENLKAEQRGKEEGKVEIFNNIIQPRLEVYAQNYNKAVNEKEKETLRSNFFKELKKCKSFFPDWDNKKLMQQVNKLKNSLNLKLNDIELQR